MSDFKIEDRGGIMVLSDRIGCRPATHAEVEFYAEIDQLRREVAEALKWRDYYRSKYLAPRDWVDDETKLRRELAEARAENERLRRWFVAATEPPTPRKIPDCETCDDTGWIAETYSAKERRWSKVPCPRCKAERKPATQGVCEYCGSTRCLHEGGKP